MTRSRWALAALAVVAPLALYLAVSWRAGGPAVVRSPRVRMQAWHLAAEELRARSADAGCPSLEDLRREAPRDVSPRDEWGAELRVVCTGERTVVWSAGEDGVFATPDDVRVPDAPGD